MALKNDFIMRFQQLTAPAMAKGAEDTAFYCYNRLVSLNEVGGDPGQFGIDGETFHDACRRRQARWPNSMLATSTHDTKRSEDVRSRINLLSEMPEAWRKTVLRWSALNARHRRHDWPDRNAEYLYYQTLVGAWPLSLERAQAYMEKASCEAKQHTDWTRRNTTYDTALRDFVAGTLQDPEFKSDLEQFVTPLVEAGRVNSLAQTLIKLTAPGVPDIYQGTELWDLGLVDPDNRRPVDFDVRRGLLEDAATLSAEEAWRRREEGLPKLWLIRKTLAVRAQRPEWFAGTSAYEPLAARGSKAGHAVAFMRGAAAITLVPRLVLGLKADWTDTRLELPPGNWRNELTGEMWPAGNVLLSELLNRFPVALLLGVPDTSLRDRKEAV
jgi:(1->4)-alpha-D-glucan 1-alpha-D-glucosylmutase